MAQAELTQEDIGFIKELRQARDEGHISRREALGALAGLGIGGAASYGAMGTASADASTSDSDGNVGTPSDPVDVFAEGIDSNSISTKQANISTVAAAHETASDAATGGDGTFSNPFTGGAIQSTLDSIESSIAEQPGEVIVDGAFNEAVNMATAGKALVGRGIWHSRIAASSEDIVDISADDVALRNIWVKVNSGSVNGIHATGGANSEEVLLEGVEVEGGVTGCYLDTSRSVVRGFYGQAQDSYAFRIPSGTNANRCFGIGGTNSVVIQGQDHVVHAVTVQKNSSNTTEEYGLFIGNNDNLVSGTVTNVDGGSPNHGVRMNGSGNVFMGTSEGNTGDDIVFGTAEDGTAGQADDCVAFGRFGDVTFTSNATGCKVYGTITGTVTNNGTSCSTV